MKNSKLIVSALSILLVIAAVVCFANNTIALADTDVGDAAAGVEYMKKSCTICHSVPDPCTIRPFDMEGGAEFLATHMVEFCAQNEENVQDMVAYFYHLN